MLSTASLAKSIWRRLVSDPIHIGTDRQLFLDDFIIETLSGARRKMHQPVRREKVIRPEHPWEAHLAIHAQQFRDGDGYRMIYGCAAGDPDNGNARVTAMAESDDGITWTKPSLGVISLDGSTENNLVWIGPGKNVAVFLDENPGATADARYKAIARGNRGSDGKDTLLAMSSPDGVRWRLMSDTPIFDDGPFDTHNIAFWDTGRGEYVLYARSAHGVGSFKGGVRWVRRSTSNNFKDWTPWEQIDCGDTPWEHLYTNACVQYDRAPGTYMMFPSRFVPDRIPNPDWPFEGVSDVVLMSSRDGLRFDRSFMEAFIRPGPDNWHERSLYITRGILQTSPTEMSLYGREHSSLPDVHFLRYSLRTDGFVSVNAGYGGGEITTKPLVFDGGELEINYSTSAVGSLRVEVQEAGGRPIPGFSLDDCPDHFGDEIEGAVRWSSGASLSALAGSAVRLRFAIKDADLYAFKFNP